MAWTLANLRAKFRSLTGRGTVTDISNADCNSHINEYLQYRLPIDAQLDRFDNDYVVEMTATDSGEYSISEDVLALEPPIFANDNELAVYQDKEEFWRAYPSEEDWFTAPQLEIGTSSEAAVGYSAFTYLGSDGHTRTATASEVALSGETVPQSKYGAWLLEIDDDGTVDVLESPDNITGYNTAALAVDALPAPTSGCIVMGYVTATHSAGTFIPGTTLLSAAGVTDTYTDGHPGLRGQPQSVLVNRSQGKLYVRPKCDDTYQLKSQASLTRPTALVNDSDTLPDEAWGMCVALGASLLYLTSQEGEGEKVAELDFGGLPYNPNMPGPGSFRNELNKMLRKEARQINGRIIPRAF